MNIKNIKPTLFKPSMLGAMMLLMIHGSMAHSAPLLCDGEIKRVGFKPAGNASQVIVYMDFDGVNETPSPRVLVMCKTNPANPNNETIPPKNCEHVFDQLVSAKIASHKIRFIFDDQVNSIFSGGNNTCEGLKHWGSMQEGLTDVIIMDPF